MAHEWGLRPAFNNHVKLLAGQLKLIAPQSSSSVKGSHILYRHNSIRFVHLVGTIVSENSTSSSSSTAAVKIVLDDGTGTAECHIYMQETDSATYERAKRACLGDTVAVLGELKMNRYDEEKRQVSVSALRFILDPNERLLHCLQVLELHHNMYTKPFPLTADLDQDSLRAAMAGSDNICTCGAPYTSAFGYCPCVDAFSSQEQKKILHSVLLALHKSCQLKTTKPPTFTFQELKDDPLIATVFDEIHTSSNSNSNSTSLRSKVQGLRQALSRLRRDCIVRLINEDHDQYLLASFKDWLGPTIRQVACHIGIDTDTTISPHFHDRIVREIQNRHPWLPGVRIRSCLQQNKYILP